jgi:hypothetical protein
LDPVGANEKKKGFFGKLFEKKRDKSTRVPRTKGLQVPGVKPQPKKLANLGLSDQLLKEWEEKVGKGQETEWSLSPKELDELFKGRAASEFLRWRVFNAIFESREAVPDEQRGNLWLNLLEAEARRNSAQVDLYQKLVNMENGLLEQTIDKDQIADRSNLILRKSGKTLTPDP